MSMQRSLAGRAGFAVLHFPAHAGLVIFLLLRPCLGSAIRLARAVR